MIRYEETLRPIDRLLTLAVRGQRSDVEQTELLHLLANADTEQVIATARENQVLPLVAAALCEIIPDDPIDARWTAICHTNSERVAELKQSLVRVVSRLEAMGCQSAVIENGGVLLGTRMPLAAFSAGDFDLLVSGGDWADILAAFQAEQFQPQDRRGCPTNRREFMRGTPPNDVQWLNAGYDPFDRMWIPLSYTDRTALWLKRRVISTQSAGLWVLAPQDALTFVAIHTSLHSYVRAPGIRLHVDVDRLVRDTEIDWTGFVTEVRATGLITRAFVSLAMAHALLATPIPEWVLEALYPGKRRWSMIRHLLSQEGVFTSGKPKLTPLKAIWLDMLLEDKGMPHWLRMLLFPPGDWMREHFSRTAANERAWPLGALYMRRWTSGLGRWSPR